MGGSLGRQVHSSRIPTSVMALAVMVTRFSSSTDELERRCGSKGRGAFAMTAIAQWSGAQGAREWSIFPPDTRCRPCELPVRLPDRRTVFFDRRYFLSTERPQFRPFRQHAAAADPPLSPAQGRMPRQQPTTPLGSANSPARRRRARIAVQALCQSIKPLLVSNPPPRRTQGRPFCWRPGFCRLVPPPIAMGSVMAITVTV